MTNTKTITDFRVTWEADYEQYWQGHGIAMTDWTHCATGVGETLREAFENVLEDLAQQGILFAATVDIQPDAPPIITSETEDEMLAELTAQVKEPEMLDWDIRKTECLSQGDVEDCECAVCAGEWHYYVSIDVKVEEGI